MILNKNQLALLLPDQFSVKNLHTLNVSLLNVERDKEKVKMKINNLITGKYMCECSYEY